MKESDFQRKLLKALRTHPALKGAVIFKHSDMWNAGIPDLSITLDGKTTWWEIKVGKNNPTKLQKHFLDRLKPASHLLRAVNMGNAWIDDNFFLPFDELIVEISRVACRQGAA